MTTTIRLRPMLAGEFSEPHDQDAEFDDFGPRQGYAVPPPCTLDGDGGALAVEVDDRLAGMVSWRWWQWGPNTGSRCPMIGIWLTAESRGAGVGTAAQRQLVDLFFRHTTTNRVEAHTDVNNVAEARALEKVGFTREGLTRGAQWRNGAYRDGYLYAILRGDRG